MQVLLANLELVFECRGFWLTWLFYGVMIGLGLLMAQIPVNMALFIALVVAALPVGWTVAGMQVEVASKPFSFCLPDRGRSIRRFVFLVGTALSALAGWALATGQAMLGGGPVQVALLLCLGLCLTMAIYLIGVGLAFSLKNSPLVSGFMGCIIWAVFVLAALHPPSLVALRDYLLPVILSGASVALAAWYWLGRASPLRVYCDKPVAGPLFATDYGALQRKRQAMASAALSRSHPAIDRYFLGIMRSCEHSGAARSTWGILYTALLPLIPPWKTGICVALVLLAVGLWAGYEPSAAPFVITFFPLIAALNVNEVHQSVLSESPLVGGRRERFYASITLLGLVAGVSILGFMVTILLLSWLMPLIPEVRIGSLTLTFHPIPLGLLALPTMAFPLLGLASIRLSGKWLSGVVMITVLMLFGRRDTPVSGISFQTVLLATSLSWVICVLGVYRIAMRSDLGRN